MNRRWFWGRILSSIGVLAAVLVLNASNYALIDTIPVDVAPEELAVSPDGKRVYVTNPGDYSVSEIRTSTNTVLKTIDLGFYTRDVVVSPDGSRAYVTVSGTDELVVLQLV